MYQSCNHLNTAESVYSNKIQALMMQKLFSGMGLLAMLIPIFISLSIRAETARQKPQTILEQVATLPHRPDSIAITATGRIIYALQGNPDTRDMYELLKDGKTRPFPAQEPGRYKSWSQRMSQDGLLWSLDAGAKNRSAKLQAFDLNSNRLVRQIIISASAQDPFSNLQDFVIDNQHGKIYIADSRGGVSPLEFSPALVVVDLKTGSARRLLIRHHSVLPENLDTLIDGQQLTVSLGSGARVSSRWGINGIGIDPQEEWVYFGPMTSHSFYRIATEHLADDRLSDAEIADHVERYGDKEIGDGIFVDSAGNVYNSDVQHYAIGLTDANGKYHRILEDRTLLSFPDHMAAGYDGYIYLISIQAHLGPFFNEIEQAKPPFYILRFRPLASIQQH